MTAASARSLHRDKIWAACAALSFAWLLVWPLLGPMALALDDVGIMLQTHAIGDFRRALEMAWRGALFRPLLIVSSSLIDPVQRTGPAVVLLHGLLLGAALVAVWRLASTPEWGAAPSLVCALWLLHPGVSVSVWQMDTLSQTASAAAGLWLLERVLRPSSRRGRDWSWISLTLIGLLTKETFLGWLPVAVLIELHRQRRLSRGAWVALLLAGAFVLSRMAVLSATGHGEERYPFHFGGTALKNALTLVAGGLSYGPLHALRLLDAASPSWWLALIGMAVSALLLIVTALQIPEQRRPIVWLGALSLFAFGPVLLLGHVSELYLMGPNALLALALARCVEAFWPLRPRITSLAVGTLVACALFGLASRSYHFGLTWRYSRALAAQVAELTTQAVGLIGDQQASVDGRCDQGFHGHSVYIATPLQALSPKGTEEVLRAAGRPLPANWTLALDCRHLPPRRAW